MNITRILSCFRSFSRALAKDRVDVKGDAGADPENPERDGRDTCRLYRYFLCFRAFYKNNTKFQRKRSGRGPVGPPLQGHSQDFSEVRTTSQNPQIQILSLLEDWLICQGREKTDEVLVKACSRFYACISSLLNKPELHSESRELST